MVAQRAPRAAAIPLAAIIGILAGCGNKAVSPDATDTGTVFDFSGAPSRETLEAYLSRAITMSDLFTSHADNKMSVEEGIRFVTNIGAKFLGRVTFVYANEELLDDILTDTRVYAAEVHREDPRIVLQAAIFEIITPTVDTITVPSHVLEAFSLDTSSRTFTYEDMLFDADGMFGHNTNVFGEGMSVPDITKQETQLWYYHLASSYLDAGIEAVHLGIFDWVTEADSDMKETSKLLNKIRAYAAENARRKWVFLDAHTHGMTRGTKLLLDFHASPLLPVEGSDENEAVLKRNVTGGIYGKSKGGTTPAGWSCDALPYLVEFDHGYSKGSIAENTDENYIWGHTEITWFATRPDSVRDAFLSYAHARVRAIDPAAHLEMPGLRPIWVNYSDHPEDFYYANAKSTTFPHGYGQEETIRKIWSAEK